MKSWRKRFQQFWMSTDIKPKGKDRRYIEKQNRHDGKREIEAEVSELVHEQECDEDYEYYDYEEDI